MLQKCTNCGESKPLTEYYPKQKNGYIIRTECKDCMKKKAIRNYKKLKAKKLFTTLVEVTPPSIERDLFLWKLAIAGGIGLLFIGIAYSLIFILG